MPGPGGGPLGADDVKAYEDAGLDELLLSVPARDADDLLAQLGGFLSATR